MDIFWWIGESLLFFALLMMGNELVLDRTRGFWVLVIATRSFFFLFFFG